MTRVSGLSVKQPFWSVARTVIEKLPVCVGVPESVAVPGVNVIGVGKVPVSVHVIAPTPFVWVNVTGPYAMPAVPAARLAGRTPIVGQLMTRESDWVPVQPFWSVALTVIG